MKFAVTVSLLVLATLLEAGGDAVVRVGLQAGGGLSRALPMIGGAALLFGYGLTLNLAPVDWGRLMGAYVATFFVVAQIINLVAFRTPPGAPIVVGGLFIVAGGAIVTLWRP